MNEKLIKVYIPKSSSSSMFSGSNSGISTKYINVNREDIMSIEFTKSGAVKIVLKADVENIVYIDKDQENLKKLQEIFDDEVDIPSELLLATMADENLLSDQKSTTSSNSSNANAVLKSLIYGNKIFMTPDLYSVFGGLDDEESEDDGEE